MSSWVSLVLVLTFCAAHGFVFQTSSVPSPLPGRRRLGRLSRSPPPSPSVLWQEFDFPSDTEAEVEEDPLIQSSPSSDLARESLKKDFLAAVVSTNRGFSTTSLEKETLMDLIQQLEKRNPNPEPLKASELSRSPLFGEWRLLYTNAIDVLLLGAIPVVQVGRIFQNVFPPKADRDKVSSPNVSEEAEGSRSRGGELESQGDGQGEGVESASDSDSSRKQTGGGEGTGGARSSSPAPVVRVENVVEFSPQAEALLTKFGGIGPTVARLRVRASGVPKDGSELEVTFEGAAYEPQTLFGFELPNSLDPLWPKVDFSNAPAVRNGRAGGPLKTTYVDADLRIARGVGQELYVLGRVRS